MSHGNHAHGHDHDHHHHRPDFRLPAEWEPQDGVQLTWPHAASDWADMLDEVEPVFVAIAKAVSRFERLLVVCHDHALRHHVRQLLTAAGAHLEQCRLVLAPTNDTWARDHGAITVEYHGRQQPLSFRFNGWGGKFDATLDNAKERPRYGMVYPTGWLRNGQPTPRADKMSGEYVSSEVVNWLDNKKDSKPFFLYVAFTEVHSPLASPKKYLDMYSQYMSDYQKQHPDLFYGDWADKPWRGVGEYYANISYLDAQVGKVLDKIKAMGEEDNTIVIFTSDNGPVTREARKVYELNLAGETVGLRGRKDNLWEGGIRVPAIIKYGKHLPQGMVSDTPVYGLDWMPTLAKMMNFKLPTDRTFDGESLVPVLEQKALKREKPLIFGIDMPFQDDPTDEWAIRDGDWKMIIDRNNKPKYLYNLKSDRYETLNLIGKKPDIEKQMYGKFLKYKTDIDNDSLMKARGDKPEAVTWG